MLKRTIGLGLLCMASHAYSANIVVNTTEDEFDDKTPNSTCSLREAIELINRVDANGKFPEAGFGGCAGKDASASIVLEAGKTYTLSKQIEIKQSLSINILDEYGNSTKYNGAKNASIEAKGNHRLFLIGSNNPGINNLIVSISQVDLIGCTAEKVTNSCDVQGGLIFNRENLSISFSRLSNGRASDKGGAIYNEGIANPGSPTASASQLSLDTVLFQNNKAAQGAALYSVQPRYEITNSVFRDNEAIGNDGTIIFVSRANDLNSEGGSTRTGNIINSTIFDNKGIVANLLDGMVINNSTIIKNTAGIYLNSTTGAANLSNSIVAGNTRYDCSSGSNNKAVTNNLVFNTGCGNGTSDNPNFDLDDSAYPQEKPLLANANIGGEKSEGKCDEAAKPGLLCPFQYEKEMFNGFFKPRLLTSYGKLSDSHIINRGQKQVKSDDTDEVNYSSCVGADQRGVEREANVLCDIGAIELIIEDKGKIGQDIKFNQNAAIDLTDYLGDGQLWPADQCENLFKDLPGAASRRIGTSWEPGCPKFVDGKQATKGELLLDSDALLKYTPFRNYHGADYFSLEVVTTTSRFSQGANDRAITLRGTIVQDPENTFENKSVNVSGGSAGLVSLFGMLGLIWIRRRLQGAN